MIWNLFFFPRQENTSDTEYMLVISLPFNRFLPLSFICRYAHSLPSFYGPNSVEEYQRHRRPVCKEKLESFQPSLDPAVCRRVSSSLLHRYTCQLLPLSLGEERGRLHALRWLALSGKLFHFSLSPLILPKKPPQSSKLVTGWPHMRIWMAV